MMAALMFMTASLFVQAQTVDEILERHFEAIGGLEKWKALESTKMTGVMYMGGMEFPGVISAKTPNKQRVDVNVQGKSIVQAYDGTVAWWINPFAGGEDAQEMPEEMASEMKKQEFASAFIDYAAKGHTVELMGQEEVEGAQCFVLKMTKKNGDVEHYYLDSEFYVPIMVKTVISSGPAKGQEAMTYLSDYQEVDGLMMAFSIEVKAAGQTMQKIAIKTVETNPKLDDASFTMPKK